MNNYHRYIDIELYDEGKTKNLVKIKSTQIDLKRYQVNLLTKGVIRLNETIKDINNQNYITSEIEWSMLLSQPGASNNVKLPQGSSLFKIYELEEVILFSLLLLI